MRHAAARQDHGLEPERGDGARHRLAERVAALHGRLRRQIGVDVDRQHRAGVAEMGERNADGVVDLGGAGEGRIEILPVELAHELEADLARNLPVEFAAGEFAGRLAADMHGEGRRRGVEELLGVIVGEDDPEVGLRAPAACLPMSAATSRTCATTALSSVSGMVKNCGAWGSMAPPITVDIMVVPPLSEKYRARQAATRRSLPSLRGACASHAAIKPVRSCSDGSLAGYASGWR